ncbi:aspartate kinase [Listeria fleischmannii]|jgi:aspartate kinase|uniref:Aspartokinase n=1 Tax=Listeria fleischmannii TaxID=1069827 RepID=A0A841YAU0_9LIST|nr:aspartate kinase [Listeria fleischmannii]EIA19957.1 aspartate kinase [Listeria fleischmannii subsp. coloradonensis]MBC1397380.1 aspartate kinase [Listeria fleischmannii]MBC1419397.1 aspartate kinase [Listeria fleischmannii]MBC1425749.1 aspartate kinase [Listeria fleischmannii]STY35309.1 Aspartokinase 2 [Listeria fleischmannii subsp. coloradonensis]
MGLVVLKFGGTSVSSVSKIQKTAEQAVSEHQKGNQVIVVVSAMGKSTDKLVQMAEEITTTPSKREMDMLLATGEQITISLLAMALQEQGQEAISYTGWQAGIETEAVHGNARILDMEHDKIMTSLGDGKIVIVAGFQGVTRDGEITTLGRGGSDTTAVALAAEFSAEKCVICTDVDGVYTTDPRFIKRAQKLTQLTYDEMLELANLGAGVLHPRSVEYAKNFKIPLEVRLSHGLENGTMIEEEMYVENAKVVRGIAFEDQLTRVTIHWSEKENMRVSKVFSELAKNNIDVDIIIQGITGLGHGNLSFTIQSAALLNTLAVLENKKTDIQYEKLESEQNLAKVSIVGSGMVSNPGVAARMFEALTENDVPIKMISTSEIKVSTVVPERKMVEAAQVLHDTFELEN